MRALRPLPLGWELELQGRLSHRASIAPLEGRPSGGTPPWATPGPHRTIRIVDPEERARILRRLEFYLVTGIQRLAVGTTLTFQLNNDPDPYLYDVLLSDGESGKNIYVIFYWVQSSEASQEAGWRHGQIVAGQITEIVQKGDDNCEIWLVSNGITLHDFSFDFIHTIRGYLGEFAEWDDVNLFSFSIEPGKSPTETTNSFLRDIESGLRRYRQISG